MNPGKIHIIGIGFKPLEARASMALLNSDVVLSNARLLDVFKDYRDYPKVKDRVIVHDTVQKMLEYMEENFLTTEVALIAAGDPMFYGIGRMILEKFDKKYVEIYPDLSSVQVAFSRVKETSNNAMLISFHGGPDPQNRRSLEYEVWELPALLTRHSKVAILTDRINNPDRIAQTLLDSGEFGAAASAPTIFVCEKLGYRDEAVTSGTPAEIAGRSFAHPNVVIIKAQSH